MNDLHTQPNISIDTYIFMKALKLKLYKNFFFSVMLGGGGDKSPLSPFSLNVLQSTSGRVPLRLLGKEVVIGYFSMDWSFRVFLKF